MLAYFILFVVGFVSGFAVYKHRADLKEKAAKEQAKFIAKVREGL